MSNVKRIRNVYAVVDARGKVVDLAFSPNAITGLEGWSVVKGAFVANKRQAKPARRAKA